MLSLRRRAQRESEEDGYARHSKKYRLANTEIPDAAIRCGKLIRMHLVNFMCHSNLVIDFHSRVNFLVGSNGSGKSAIIAALVLGLGCKASATERSSNVKQFIRVGQRSTTIEITLSNEGPNGYETSVYGDRVTVVRTITQSSSTYCIKNSSGVIVSRKAIDLHRLLMFHNVQVDNPVFVLNQDAARAFLKDSDPSKNYKFFLKATQIDDMIEKLNDCYQVYQEQQESLQSYEMSVAKNEAEIEKLKHVHSELMSIEEMKERLLQKEIEHAWLLVTLEEAALQQTCDAIKEAEEQRTNNLVHVGNRVQFERECKKAMKKLEEEIVRKNAEIKELNAICVRLKDTCTKKDDQCTEIRSYLQSYNKQRTFVAKQISELENYIRNRSESNVTDIDELRRRNGVLLDELQKNRDENATQMAAVRRDLETLMETRMKHEEEIEQIQKKHSAARTNIARLQANIKSISNNAKDQLSIYGESVRCIVAEVERFYRDGKFAQMPRGPIGRYVEVPNGDYRNLIENQMGNLLQAFLCDNTKDRHMLEKIIRRRSSNYHPVIITANFTHQIYDISDGRVTAVRGTRLLMDEIRCSDPVVMNCLIDRLHIETILVTNRMDVAESITSESENVPRNLNKVLVPAHGLECYPQPNYRMYSLDIRPAHFIHVNVQDRIVQLKTEMSELQQMLATCDADLSDAQAKRKANDAALAEKRSVLKRDEAQGRDVHAKIMELEQFEYPESNEVDILKEELVQNTNKLQSIVTKIESKEEELERSVDEKKLVDEQCHKQLVGVRDAEKELEKLKHHVDEKREEMRKGDRRYRNSAEQMTRIAGILEQLTLEKKNRSLKVRDETTQASAVGERVTTESTERELIKEIRKLKTRINVNQHSRIDRHQLAEEICSKEHALQEDHSKCKRLKISMETLRKARYKRCEMIRQLKQHMSLLLQFCFDHILKLRTYTGRIQVDHDQQTLTITVTPRENHRVDRAVCSTHSLSGGERSYTTIAFLISLWACVDHPFYFLDEYDVFTDEVNREFMTRLLINEGKKKPMRQYFFLTPQEMSIDSNDFIKIHRFAEPERR